MREEGWRDRMSAESERGLIDALKSLVPLVREHAAEAERQRKPVDAVMQAIEDTGAYRWFVPKAYGGFEYSLSGFMDVGVALGEACASHAWGDHVLYGAQLAVGFV